MSLFRDRRNATRHRWYHASLVLIVVIVALASASGRPLVSPALRWITRTPEPLLAALAALDLKADRALITGWVEVRGSLDLEDGAHLALQALQVLAGPDLAYGLMQLDDINQVSPGSAADPADAVVDADAVEYLVSAPDCLYRSRVRIVSVGTETRVFLVCSAEIRSPVTLEERRGRLELALNTLGTDATMREPVYVTVFARLPKVLDGPAQRQAADKVLTRLRAAAVHEFDGETLYSMLSHSRLLEAAVPVAGRQVNFSVVLRPDEANGCTWVVLGTPLCAGDY